MRHFETLAIAAVGAMSFSCAFAQGAPGSFPSKPVTLVVPLAAGGPVDIESRLYAGKLAELTGQPFVLDYKPGAAGTIAAGYVVKAAPDGYTINVTTGAYSTFSALYKNLSFDPIKDLAPVTLMSRRPQLMLVVPSFPVRTIAEYIAHSRAHPGKINFGTTGEGSGTHLGGAWLHSATNTKVTFIHYKGTGPLLPDLFSGRLDVTLAALSLSMPLIKSGKVRALAIMGDKRTPFLPDLPSVSERTVPGYDYAQWTGFSAPAATPTATVRRLNEIFVKVVRLPAVSKTVEADGNEVVGSTPAQFRQLIVSETERWRKLVREIGIKQEE